MWTWVWERDRWGLHSLMVNCNQIFLYTQRGVSWSSVPALPEVQEGRVCTGTEAAVEAPSKRSLGGNVAYAEGFVGLSLRRLSWHTLKLGTGDFAEDTEKWGRLSRHLLQNKRQARRQKRERGLQFTSELFQALSNTSAQDVFEAEIMAMP